MGRKIILVVMGLVVVAAAALLYGTRRWQRATDSLVAQLEAGRVPIAPQRYDPGELAGLPAPVQRYVQTVLTPGQPMVTAVKIEHTGTFNMSADGEQWVPFTSSQHVVTRGPGFIWDARMPMMPGVTVHVHDAYVGGEGTLHAALFGLMPVMEMAHTPELAQGEFLRYLAESAWYPTALLPSQGVTWEAVDETSAKATLTDDATTATLLFHFDGQGLIDWVRAKARGRTVGDTITYAPWEGRWRNYTTYAGMTVPTDGEVLWLLPEGEKPYWRGHVARLSYAFTDAQAE